MLKGKLFIGICCLILMAACSRFEPDWVIRHQDELSQLVNEAKASGIDVVQAREQTHMARSLKSLGLNSMTINYRQEDDFIRADSLVFFGCDRRVFSVEAKHIVYDFAQQPRNFGSQNIPNASYQRKQVNERWYIETIGFD